MTIKEVNELTGLSQKSIRFYEEKGLINVERNKQNDYRNYSDENIEKLKLIKILRFLDFSIEEIETILKSNNLFDALEQKSKDLENRSNNYLEKQVICDSLKRNINKEEFKKNIEEYSNTINFLESDDGNSLKRILLEFLTPSISHVIIESIILLGPIISLFINIYMKLWDALILNSIFAIICSQLLVLAWISYFDVKQKHKETVKSINKRNSLTIPGLIISLIMIFSSMIFLSWCIEKFIAPDDYLFYEESNFFALLLMYSVVYLMIVILGLAFRKLKLNKSESIDVYVDIYQKYRFILIVVFVAILYCFITSITFVTKDEIIYRNPIHPIGIHYKYSDVNKIETGFGTKNWAFIEYNRKGKFYYRIFIDNKKITFSVPSINSNIERYKNDTYLELEDFDNELMKFNIEKISDNQYSNYCILDKVYVDRFIRIINNR